MAYFENGKYIEHVLLDYSKNKVMESRFESMAKEIWEMLNKYRPDIIYIEEVYMSGNAQTMKILTRLQGVVYAWAMKNNCEFNTVLPSAWRKVLKLNGKKGEKRKELKQKSINYVNDTYGILVTDDESDAICIGDAVIRKFGDC